MAAEEIVSVYRNYSGDIISFQTSQGRIISYRKALLEAVDEKISGVLLLEPENGNILFDHTIFEDLPSYY
ncbi:hypothetical protein J27TS8_08310 [Robertmurraya siralis]|uniref:Uncharacterized protein n=1 Tax=Robertmurraya siralis TaxID=77777 RepID=A0A919WF59_9BACI|nr:hypothetical protein [Robertmurraya siralis]PAE22200.1 hypothetical protein CHH80_01920 [Bacillus sp. 7504-2]GIN60838.1 hypothetical protein J27TS8_08310 [Robertmurraya siralis]